VFVGFMSVLSDDGGASRANVSLIAVSNRLVFGRRGFTALRGSYSLRNAGIVE